MVLKKMGCCTTSSNIKIKTNKFQTKVLNTQFLVSKK